MHQKAPWCHGDSGGNYRVKKRKSECFPSLKKCMGACWANKASSHLGCPHHGADGRGQRGHLACLIRALCCDWFLPCGIPPMSERMKEAAPAADSRSQLISAKTFSLTWAMRPAPSWGRGRQGGGGHSLLAQEAASRAQVQEHPLSISSTPVPEQREKGQPLGAASRPGYLERRLES